MNEKALLTKNLSEKDQQRLIKEIEQLQHDIDALQASISKGAPASEVTNRFLQESLSSPIKFTSVGDILPQSKKAF